MPSMLDNVRAWWNNLAENLGDPGKLAQLSVADLEKSIRRAKEAAAPVVGRPAVLANRIKEMEKTDADLTKKITSLIQAGEEGKASAMKFVERQIEVRRDLEALRDEFDDTKAAADEWQSKIRTLETELNSRRNEANRLQAQLETARAEQRLGKHMQNADSLMGSDKFSSIKARVEKEQAKAAGFSAMSGLDSKVADDRLLRKTEADSLMDEYLSKLNG